MKAVAGARGGLMRCRRNGCCVQHKTRDTMVDAVAGLLYAADYRYALPPVVDGTPLVHLWSLSVEEQLYFIWPLLLIAVLKWDRRAALCATILLNHQCRRLARFPFCHAEFCRIYFAFDTRAGELLIGYALALWRPQLNASKVLCLWPGVVLFFVAFALRVGLGGHAQPYINIIGYPLFGAAAAYLIVVVTRGERNLPTLLLTLRPIVALGRISYGFYLWHVLIVRGPGIEGRLPVIATFVLTLAASAVSYSLIERPFRRRKFKDDIGLWRAKPVFDEGKHLPVGENRKDLPRGRSTRIDIGAD
jgi:peptidoglycan/LPS O-acetylase OafA/YrhL